MLRKKERKKNMHEEIVLNWKKERKTEKCGGRKGIKIKRKKVEIIKKERKKERKIMKIKRKQKNMKKERIWTKKE